jgi:hypothetical protein
VVLPAAKNSVAPLSFINLMEFHVLVALRRTHRLPMQRVRSAIEYGKRTYGVEHPLAEDSCQREGRNGIKGGAEVHCSEMALAAFMACFNVSYFSPRR